MKLLASIIVLFMLIGCASKPQPGELASDPECSSDEFRGLGIAENENEALTEAHSALSRQISSSISVTTELTVNQQVSNGKENLASEYGSRTVVESVLSNAQDARVATKKRNGNKIRIVVCMSRANAAKGFVNQLRPVADSLKFAASNVIDAKHPMLKSEAWQKTKPLWNKFIGLYSMIESLNKETSVPFEPVRALYTKAEAYYLDFCQTAKLYWNPELDDIYSEIAFSKLSKNLKLEKATCNGQGILLSYKNTGHKCEHAGMFVCSHKPSLLIASCSGEQYRLLESGNVESYQKVEDVALEKLHEKLRNETFWNEWEQEIKQWRPICQ